MAIFRTAFIQVTLDFNKQHNILIYGTPTYVYKFSTCVHHSFSRTKLFRSLHAERL